MQILRGRRTNVNGLAVSPDSRFVAAHGQHDLHVWDLADAATRPACLRSSEVGDRLRASPGFFADGRLFADYDTGWRMYDPLSRQTATCARLDTDPLFSSAVLCEPFVVAVEPQAAARLTGWRLAVDGHRLSRELAWSRPWDVRVAAPSALTTPDGNRLLVARPHNRPQDAAWQMVRAADGEPLAVLPSRSDWHNPKCYSPDGRELYEAVHSWVFAWDTHAGGASREVLRHPQKRHLRDIAVSPDGRTLAGLTGDNCISFFDRASGGLLRTYDFKVGELKHLAFAPDGTRCVAAGSRGQVLLFDVE